MTTTMRFYTALCLGCGATHSAPIDATIKDDTGAAAELSAVLKLQAAGWAMTQAGWTCPTCLAPAESDPEPAE